MLKRLFVTPNTNCHRYRYRYRTDQHKTVLINSGCCKRVRASDKLRYLDGTLYMCFLPFWGGSPSGKISCLTPTRPINKIFWRITLSWHTYAVWKSMKSDYNYVYFPRNAIFNSIRSFHLIIYKSGTNKINKRNKTLHR